MNKCLSFRWLLNLWIFYILILLQTGCKKGDDPAPEPPFGTVFFTIAHEVNGQPLKENELVYTNAAGNEYLVTEVKYFISDITFYHHDGSQKVIGDWKDIFYVDEDISETKLIRFPDKIPIGIYDSITLIFGITEEKNQSFMYVNPPEVLMGWPQILGGGYHYMMMNGKWKDINGFIMPFNFHLGIGQLYKGNDYNTDSIYAFVQNYFKVSLPGSSFIMEDHDTITFRLTMNIESWFENPHVFDFNHWGGAIMQNQPALQMAKENGWNVFSIKRFENFSYFRNLRNQ